MNKYPCLSEAVAKTLQYWREERQLSQRKLFELARLERVYLIQLEKGQKKPALNALFCICEALDVRPSEFDKLKKK